MIMGLPAATGADRTSLRNSLAHEYFTNSEVPKRFGLRDTAL